MEKKLFVLIPFFIASCVGSSENDVEFHEEPLVSKVIVVDHEGMKALNDSLSLYEEKYRALLSEKSKGMTLLSFTIIKFI
tara:strand:+ start:2422 stop:2661 length:240 start_codon:yes stop_codon:yes gene_type:complete